MPLLIAFSSSSFLNLQIPVNWGEIVRTNANDVQRIATSDDTLKVWNEMKVNLCLNDLHLAAKTQIN